MAFHISQIARRTPNALMMGIWGRNWRNVNIVRWIAYSLPSEKVYAGFREVEMSNDSYRNSIRR